MSTVINETPVDLVCLGAGFMSGAVAAEVARDSHNYQVVAITKGPWWDYVSDFSTTKYDEWGVGLGRKYDSPLPLQSTTIRNDPTQFALPVRRYTMPIQYHALGHGVGGAAQHYGGTMGRQGPWGYKMKSLTDSAYPTMLSTIQPNNDLQDWPLDYTGYEPYYHQWELAYGLCGTNNGSPTDVNSDTHYPWMDSSYGSKYPMPPHPLTPLAQQFQSACLSSSPPQGGSYHPFPHVSSLASQAYLNKPYGVPVNPCVYDGYCGGNCNYACETGAKANAAYRTIPAAMATGNFKLVTNAYIFRLVWDPTTNTVTECHYYDAQGNVHIQKAKVFFNGMWGYNMIRIMLLSGVGQPYVFNSGPPQSGAGSVGRGLTNGYSPYQGTSVSGTVNLGSNKYPAGNASGGGIDIYDLMDDNFSHSGLNFIGGNQISVGGYAGGGPGNITLAGGVSPSNNGVGGTFKAKQKDVYLPTTTTVGTTPYGLDIPTFDHFVDLDPHYTDIYGDPISRLTYNWTNNMYNCAKYLAPIVGQILTKMGASNVKVGTTPPQVNNDWWGHHLRGGCRIGTDPASSVWNSWNQHWLPGTPSNIGTNYFGAGEITNTSGDTVPSGTHVAGPQSYRAAEGIRKYLLAPGLLTP
jgi:gluconate 2-dehydrogenase alpha chain